MIKNHSFRQPNAGKNEWNIIPWKMKKTSSLLFRISQFNWEDRNECHVRENGMMLQQPMSESNQLSKGVFIWAETDKRSKNYPENEDRGKEQE